MKELKIGFAVAGLFFLAGFASVSLAREGADDAFEHGIALSGGTRGFEVETEHGVTFLKAHSEDDDEDKLEKKRQNTERLKKLREKNKERIEKLRKRLEEAHHRSGSGSTHTGSTQTGTVTQPAPVKPVTPPAKPVTTTPAPATPAAPTAVTRSATVNYNTPEGSVPVGFSVTVKGGVITAASSTKKAGGTSGYYQDAFIAKLSSSVVGKKALGLNLSAIGGASLTTNAFEKFVAANF